MRISPSNRPTVVITIGDPAGIGPEVTASALKDRSIKTLANFIVLGDPACKDSGTAPVRWIEEAVRILKSGEASALVTAPVNKEAITNSGIRFQGHTEYLAKLTSTKKIAMMFTGGRLRVTTVTRHIPFDAISRALTERRITDATVLTRRFLKDNLRIKAPRIGICALNPHAGEGGTLGTEEGRVISPAVRKLKRTFSHISGPIPADSAFNALYNGSLDCLIAMYHDQAMIPVKAFGREKCVNVTLGLPFVRTSPVHGTAYDIAGKGIADPSSMKEAVRLACRLAKR